MEYSDGWFTGLAARVHGFPRDPLGLKDNSDSQSGVLSGILSFKSVGEIKMKIVISALVVLVLMIGAHFSDGKTAVGLCPKCGGWPSNHGTDFS